MHNSNHEKFSITQLRLGPFYQSFKPRFWWFEVCIIVYKAILVGVLSVVAPNTPLQLFLALLICTGYMLLVLKAAPYIAENLDTLSFLCSVALSTTMLIGVLKSTNDYVTGPQKGKEGIGNIPNEMLGPLLVIVNGVPFIHVIYIMVDRQLFKRGRGRKKTIKEKNHRYRKAPVKVTPVACNAITGGVDNRSSNNVLNWKG